MLSSGFPDEKSAFIYPQGVRDGGFLTRNGVFGEIIRL